MTVLGALSFFHGEMEVVLLVWFVYSVSMAESVYQGSR